MSASAVRRSPVELDLDQDGACHAPGLAVPLLSAFFEEFSGLPRGNAGLRLAGSARLEALLGPAEAIGTHVVALSGQRMKPVRAVLFDKSLDGNWSLGWHQDRTIAVRERRDVAGFGPWSTKQGICHVEPPFALIQSMITVRIHLDAVDADNAPLHVARGSHLSGRVRVEDVEACVAKASRHVCLAEAGDVWIYRTPILHASDAVKGAARSRRVLQVDYCAQDLPGTLEWLGIG